jgi:gliding motility-associated-like protein
VDVKKGNLDLGPDREVCRGDIAGIDGKENFSWLWSDGSTGQFLNTKLGGKYWLSVFDNTGCVASDTIVISLKDVPSVNLGGDILKCKTETAILDASFPGATYTWNDGNSSASRIVTEAGLYSVKLSWNGCFARDSILVENLPGPLQDSIFGSPSICPFASDIDYQVHPIPGSVYQWFVKGGSIKTNAAHAITVDWLDTNPSASVKVLITDAQGCKGDTIFYPVRINVTLIAEIPIGPDTLCVNKSQQIVYMTPKTNGSDYQWNIIGGVITQGQGSHEVKIDWLEGLNKLWIDETAVTIDTVCHGTSEALSVYVFKDEADIELKYVSVDTSRINLINVSWGVTHSATVLDNQVMLYKKTPVTADWELLASLPATTESFDDNSNFRIEGVYQYELSMTNLCDEFIATNVHATMYLTGEADTTTEKVTLRWNHYQGWVSGVDYYEVWRKMDDDAGYRYVSTVAGDENVFTATLAADGFEHQYVIRAIEKSGSNESWSSHLNFAFEHNLTIPNIITPNGDEFNQYFNISKVELYKNSDLTITDRWGKKVHHVTNYQNDWDGNGLSTGVYFYVLDLRKNGKVYKGLISILK